MKFTARGRKYEIDPNGVIVQTDHRPYIYDPDYSAIYDTEQYKKDSDDLQEARWNFVQQSHGGSINSVYDIGYGNGAFLNFIKDKVNKKYGYDITGVELKDVYIMPGITDVKSDVATMWDVLEHFPDCSFLTDLRCKTLCVSLPYSHHMEMGLNWFENEYPHLKPDEHIRHFNPWSLNFFMYQYGWKAFLPSWHENKVRKSKHGLQNIISMAFKKI